MDFESLKVKVIPRVSTMSLIGVSGKKPVGWGNYFWIDNIRIVNMWAENMMDAVPLYLTDDLIEIIKIEHQGKVWGVVTDSRLPPNWVYKLPCFTGYYGIPKDILVPLWSYMNWEPAELEQYTDPVSYYAKKPGHEYNPETGMLRVKIEPSNRVLNTKYTINEVQDI